MYSCNAKRDGSEKTDGRPSTTLPPWWQRHSGGVGKWRPYQPASSCVGHNRRLSLRTGERTPAIQVGVCVRFFESPTDSHQSAADPLTHFLQGSQRATQYGFSLGTGWLAK